jgi:hypothetical protein
MGRSFVRLHEACYKFRRSAENARKVNGGSERHYKDAAFVSEQYTRRLVEGLFTVEYYKSEGYNNMDAFLLRAV